MVFFSAYAIKIEKQAYQLARMDSRKPVENCLKWQIQGLLLIHTFLHRLFGIKTGFFRHCSISLQVIYV